jgi:hypothetical protein
LLAVKQLAAAAAAAAELYVACAHNNNQQQTTTTTTAGPFKQLWFSWCWKREIGQGRNISSRNPHPQSHLRVSFH